MNSVNFGLIRLTWSAGAGFTRCVQLFLFGAVDIEDNENNTNC